MENDDPRAEDLPDDLTPFITRTTMDHVGIGGFGDVWKCNYNAANDGISALVAVKAFRFPESDDLEKINRNISREIGILRILRHNNIVPLWGIATGFGRIPELRCLVSPWIPNGTLSAYIKSNHNDLTVLDRSRMLVDVSAGLRYLHSESVMHGDITGENILIDKRGHARLIDFGLSTIVQPLLGQSHLARSSIRQGATRYAAPELVLSENAHELPGPLEKADIYSFGCIMLQVLSGRLPWSEIRREGLIILAMSRGCGPQRPDGHPAIIDLDWNFIQKCLQFEPELRPSAEEVLDFVIRRLSTPDSCSRPPDDPPDDAQDDFPGASPPGSSSDSDIAEQPPDSPSPHPYHELKTLTKVVDSFSASASTSSTHAHSVSESPFFYNYLSGGSSGSSTTPEHSGHSLSEMIACMWGESPCTQMLHARDLGSHLREVHGIHGQASSRPECSWNHCGRVVNRENIVRHVREVHVGSRRRSRPSAEKGLDFVMFSTPDSSRPPDDPPDDAEDGFPGASPDDGSDDSDTAEQPPNSPPLHPGSERKPSTVLHIQRSHPSSSLASPDRHPRTDLNNCLQSIYGPSVNDHVRWEVHSQGLPNALTWHAAIYIDDMNCGYASARTRGAAQDMAANQAVQHLRREGRGGTVGEPAQSAGLRVSTGPTDVPASRYGT